MIRDRDGDVRGSGAGRMQNIASALRAEAEACAIALQTASDWGMTNVELESDCQVMLKAIQSKDGDLAPEGVIFREIRDFARLNFSSISFSFVPRGCNKVAHCLAAYGSRSQVRRQLWAESLPDDVNVRMASYTAEPV